MAKIHIKNMVCSRCVTAVSSALCGLGLDVEEVTLGGATLQAELTAEQKSMVADALCALGFELLEDRQSVEVDNLCRLVLEWVHIKGKHPRLSDYLQQSTCRDYSALSKLFSSVKGMTIERYCVALRVERAKELLSYGQQNVSEIAWQMGYSSPAHLSAQFKHETGMSPSAFQKDHRHVTRLPLDRL